MATHRHSTCTKAEVKTVECIASSDRSSSVSFTPSQSAGPLAPPVAMMGWRHWQNPSITLLSAAIWRRGYISTSTAFLVTVTHVCWMGKVLKWAQGTSIALCKKWQCHSLCTCHGVVSTVDIFYRMSGAMKKVYLPEKPVSYTVILISVTVFVVVSVTCLLCPVAVATIWPLLFAGCYVQQILFGVFMGFVPISLFLPCVLAPMTSIFRNMWCWWHLWSKVSFVSCGWSWTTRYSISKGKSLWLAAVSAARYVVVTAAHLKVCNDPVLQHLELQRGTSVWRWLRETGSSNWQGGSMFGGHVRRNSYSIYPKGPLQKDVTVRSLFVWMWGEGLGGGGSTGLIARNVLWLLQEHIHEFCGAKV